MDAYQPDDRRPRTRARDRVEARRSRAMATPRVGVTSDDRSKDAPAQTPPPPLPIDYADRPTDYTNRAPRDTTGSRAARRRIERKSVTVDWGVGAQSLSATPGGRIRLAVYDLLWKIQHDVRIAGALIGIVALLALGFVGVHAVGGRVYPNIWALGVNLGSLTTDEAAAALGEVWDDLTITLIDADRTWTLTPGELGLRLNVDETIDSARSVGLAGVPFGWKILPTVELDELRAQTRLLDLTTATAIAPYNAGYQWVNDQLMGVPGSTGRFLDVTQTLDRLMDDLPTVADSGQLELVMSPAEPDVLDPSPYLDEARTLASQPFNLYGYDPFTDERVLWRTDRETFVSWIEAGANGLTLREEAFAPFLDLQTQSLEAANPLRYLEPTDAIEKVRAAIENGRTDVSLRVRYRTSTYAVESGDSGFAIARRTGVPFFLIQQANPGRDWEQFLVPGEVINLPSPDSVLELDPVPQQRIVIDLETQQLWAFENGQLVHNWLISSGMNRAPTSPGTYQVLSHEDTATGSSIELCGDNSCGSWEMYWFMGIYEVYPGLVNGFHGAVLLPGGTYLGGGNVGAPYTFGCIMSENGNAEVLYRWAQQGAVVEIVSTEYAPRSLLAQSVVAQARQARQQTVAQAFGSRS